ncbi:hypothetical protein [Geomonas ferrireducens]|uniref:hypothetical protein n=1 Tax=Geomonas ferrireducens TaxID=2570227 RepID=UPI0010A83BA8|nr:hypothetical protein [Geomonas ferrireducens]
MIKVATLMAMLGIALSVQTAKAGEAIIRETENGFYVEMTGEKSPETVQTTQATPPAQTVEARPVESKPQPQTPAEFAKAKEEARKARLLSRRLRAGSDSDD